VPRSPLESSYVKEPGAARRRRRRAAIAALTLTLICLAGVAAAPPAGHTKHDPIEPALYRPAPDIKLAVDSEAYRSAREALPPQFLNFETRRFVVLSDASPRWTREQTALLELTHYQFKRFARRFGLRPRPLRHKLVCVLFEEQEDYQKFAKDHDGVTAGWISGYYSPKHDRVVFYNIESDSAHARAPAPVLGFGHMARGRITDERVRASIATSIHETVHQLAFHTRIQSAQIQNPLWISEGLATAFETDQPRQAFGPEYDYPIRLRKFRELLEDDASLIGLGELVRYTEMPDDHDETITAVYHQSYALVSWLCRFRKIQMRDFLGALKRERPGRPTGQRHLELFEAAFGDVHSLERKWLRYERARMTKDPKSSPSDRKPSTTSLR